MKPVCHEKPSNEKRDRIERLVVVDQHDLLVGERKFPDSIRNRYSHRAAQSVSPRRFVSKICMLQAIAMSGPASSSNSTFDTMRASCEGGVCEWRRPVLSWRMRNAMRERLS